jgi:stage V sporulation protein R
MARHSLSNELPGYLRDISKEVEAHAKGYGLDFFPTLFEVVSYDQMNELAAYGGFPVRYPHWRFGMEYEQLSKSYEYGLSKIYEMVINNTPSIAYLLEGNSIVDQKLVMAHVFAHVDFFKNNFYFRATNQGKEAETGEPVRKWIDSMANHGTTIRRWADRIGIEKIEEFVDTCLSLENLIDPGKPFLPQKPKDVKRELSFLEGETEEEDIGKIRVEREYMEDFLNPREFVEAQKKKAEEEKAKAARFPASADRDVLGFLLDHAPLERWERDVLWAIRAEAYYFWPQMQTKIMNEGWACVDPDTLVFTAEGLVPMREITAGRVAAVSDGESRRRVLDQHVIADHATVTLRTRRGLVVTGSNNHRVLRANGAWARLDELAVGDRVRVSGGCDLWPTVPVRVRAPERARITLDDVASEAGTSVWTVLRHRAGRRTGKDAEIRQSLLAYDAPSNALDTLPARRTAVRTPEVVDEDLGAFLGYLVGDGHISRVKRTFGLTTGDAPQAARFAELVSRLFGLAPRTRRDGQRDRVSASSEQVADFLVEGLGLTHGPSARGKHVPEVILRSPEPVVRAFLRALFDCDGHAGAQGVILSTASERLGREVQLLLLNYGILTRRRMGPKGIWHVHAAGRSAAEFARRIGFGLERKTAALARYVDSHAQWKRESWDDEVVALEHGRGEVHDITVEETHRYAAAGLVNHNSYWHSRLMTEKICDDGEIIEYAERNAGVMETGQGRLNPYKLGVELYRYVEERWDKGQFGKEWEDCDDLEARRTWNRRTGLGRKKIFEVRSLYNDVTFIDEFLTPEFVAEQKLYSFGYNARNDRFEIETRKFKEVKEKLLFQITNAGQPFIFVEDANHGNRGELLLRHEHMGIDLRVDWAREVMKSLVRIWRRPVEIHTKVENKPTLLRFDGKEHVQRPLK